MRSECWGNPASAGGLRAESLKISELTGEERRGEEGREGEKRGRGERIGEQERGEEKGGEEEGEVEEERRRGERGEEACVLLGLCALCWLATAELSPLHCGLNFQIPHHSLTLKLVQDT